MSYEGLEEVFLIGFQDQETSVLVAILEELFTGGDAASAKQQWLESLPPRLLALHQSVLDGTIDAVDEVGVRLVQMAMSAM